MSYLPVGFMECVCFVYEVIALRGTSLEMRSMTLSHWSRDLRACAVCIANMLCHVSSLCVCTTVNYFYNK